VTYIEKVVIDDMYW